MSDEHYSSYSFQRPAYIVDATPSTTIQRAKTLTSMAYERLVAAIETAEYPFGSMLSEKLISAEFGISKTPVREALLNLQAIGLVEVLPQRGCLVRKPSREEVRQLCELRFELERAGIRLSRKRDWAPTLAAVEAIAADMFKRGRALNIRAYNSLDDQLHRAFFVSCNNALLEDTYASIVPRVRTVRSNIITEESFNRRESVEFHEGLLEALRTGDMRTIEAELSRHINNMLVEFDRTMGEGSPA